MKTAATYLSGGSGLQSRESLRRIRDEYREQELSCTMGWKRQGETRALLSSDKDTVYLVCC